MSTRKLSHMHPYKMHLVYASPASKSLPALIGSAFLFLALALAPLPVHAQALNAAQEFLASRHAALGLVGTDLDGMVVTDQYQTAHNGVTHVYFQQHHMGIGVFEGFINVNVDSGNRVVGVGNRFVGDLASVVNAVAASVGAETAAVTAAIEVGLSPVELVVTGAVGNLTTLTTGGIARQPITARLGYQPLEAGGVRLAWDVEIYQTNAQHYWSVRVDAINGEVLQVRDLVISEDFGGIPLATDAHLGPPPPVVLLPTTEIATAPAMAPLARASAGTYRVYDVPVESPNHGSRSLITTAGDPLASQLGWHNDGGADYTTTRGNNVYAHEDQLGIEAGTSPISLTLTFDYPIDLTQEPNSYVEAAVTNLFYWNNVMHDWTYRYGFDEPAGNLQTNNFGRGGLGNDAVLAQAQDGGGTNNANMLTLGDGVPARMQMYLWMTGELAELVFVHTPAEAAGAYVGIPAAFGPRLDETGVSGTVVYVDDGSDAQGSIHDFCEPLSPLDTQVLARIAMVDRGGCNFTVKISNAQTAGAVAVIVVNNEPGDPIAMGSAAPTDDAIILIPSVMIRMDAGDILKPHADPMTTTLTATLRQAEEPLPMRDGDLDNGVIAHEYGHSVSIRLTGGPAAYSCLYNDEQMGEGWSDFFGYLLTMRAEDALSDSRGIGTYLLYQPTSGSGIRQYPYSRNFGVNPFTYANVGDQFVTDGTVSVHGVGSIWATMLWDLTLDLVDAYGFDSNIYAGTGGNNIAMQLVMDGLKLQPCQPGFVDGRDAIIRADKIAFGGANRDLIWRAFARRGLGFSASQGSSSIVGDEVEAFDLPPDLQPGVRITKQSVPDAVRDGGIMAVTITIENASDQDLTGVELLETLDDGLVYLVGTATEGGSETAEGLAWTIGDLADGAVITRAYSARVATGGGSEFFFQDDMESGGDNWEVSPGLDQWELNSDNPRSGLVAWFASGPDNFSNQTLTLAEEINLTNDVLLTFWHDYNTEAGYDGGVVEISTDGGLLWTDLGPNMIENGYNGEISILNASAIQGPAFTGSSGGYIRTLVDLSDFAGEDVRIRFRLGSDVAFPGHGWYVDDVDFVRNPTVVTTTSQVTSTEGFETSVTLSNVVLQGGGIAALLQGAFQEGGAMRTALREADALPTSQPYSGEPWNYSGEESVDQIPADIVDWVLVELRSGDPDAPPMTVVARAAGLLHSSGLITAMDGLTPLSLNSAPDGDYHIVIYHRNHIGVMSATPVGFAAGQAPFDFSTAADRSYGNNAMAPLAGGTVFGLWAGDANADGMVTAPDFNAFLDATTSGATGYHAADFDLDGQVTAPDFNIFLQSTIEGAASHIPEE